MLLAKYKCGDCGHTWEQHADPGAECPRCGNILIVWLNYDKFKEYLPAGR